MATLARTRGAGPHGEGQLLPHPGSPILAPPARSLATSSKVSTMISRLGRDGSRMGAGWGAPAMGLPKGVGGPPGLRGRQQGQGQGSPPSLHSHICAHTPHTGTFMARHSPCPWSLGLSQHWEQQRGEPHACAEPPVCWHTCVCA